MKIPDSALISVMAYTSDIALTAYQTVGVNGVPENADAVFLALIVFNLAAANLVAKRLP